MTKRISVVGLVALCILAMGVTGWAQNGVITGKVTDTSGAVLPGVGLGLTSAAVMGTRTTVTDEQGGYRFDFLPPGTYTLKFDLPGFRILVREGIQMTAGFTATLNATMEVASTAETVTVVGESPIIDVQNAVVATNFTQELTQILPTGHDVYSVLAITPGVQITAPDVGGSRAGSRSQFRVFGSVSQWNVIDGAIMASLQYEDPDFYQEVQIAGASKGADAPVGGSFNNFIVKTGSKVHGLVFYDREPLRLQGSNLTPALKAQGVTNTSSVARYQSFHGDVGGPFLKDKFWWFYGFRNLNSDQLVSTTGGPNRALDPNLRLPYTEEYLGGIDQEVMRDMTVRFNFVQKFERNRMRILNTAIPFDAYNIPVTFTDPGRDGKTPQPITVFSLDRKYVGLRSDLLTNDPANSSTFTTYNLEVLKRMSKKWQLLTGFDVIHNKTWQFAQAIVQDIATDTTGVPQDPNRLRYNMGQNYWHWQYKALGSYDLPYGVGFSASLRLLKGEPYGRTLNTPSLTQGVVTLQVEPAGSSFYDTVGLLDLRFTKSFSLESFGKLEGLVDLFNINNSAAVLSRSNLTGPSYGQVLTTVNPRIARLGVRWNF